MDRHVKGDGLKLVGGLQRNPVAGDHAFIASLFERLPREVRYAGDVTRFIGYESVLEGQDHLRFFGIEVDDIEAIPDGLIAWDLGDTTATVWEARGGRDAVVWREDITWQWLDRSADDCGSPIGEFSAPFREPGDGPTRNRTWSVFADLYHSFCKGSLCDEILLVDYDPTWPEQFREMAEWLRSRLGPEIVQRVEHYGSTAIPGMIAKPVIDILLEVPSFDEGRRRALSRISSETWEFWRYSGHLVLIKRKELMGQRTHHVHIAPPGHEIWRGLAFRDHLCSHPDDAARYADLKRRLADVHRDDRERYTDAKTEFVQEIVGR
jgi:GrpB-like predicted nucleotidyltransferase (UPF0157 family)